MATGIFTVQNQASSESQLLNRGLFFGESPFTTMRMVNGKIIALDLHILRLKKSVEYLFEVDFEPFESDVRSLIENAKESSGDFYLRVTFTKSLSGEIEFFLYKDLFVEKKNLINLGLSKVIRGKGIIPSFLKVGNYLEYSCELKSRKDCNELIYQNFEGHILESGVSNIFVVKDNVVYTPPLQSGVLDGIMRQLLIQFISSENIAFKECDIKEDFMSSCDEVWLTNGLRGVRVVDNYHEASLSSALWNSISTRFNEFCENL
jgi:branched-subunit amino acid aminotransferase/4-amino-4-deoxychorismate lyase